MKPPLARSRTRASLIGVPLKTKSYRIPPHRVLAVTFTNKAASAQTLPLRAIFLAWGPSG